MMNGIWQEQHGASQPQQKEIHRVETAWEDQRLEDPAAVTMIFHERLRSTSLKDLQVDQAFVPQVEDQFAAPREPMHHHIQWSLAMTQLHFTMKIKQNS